MTELEENVDKVIDHFTDEQLAELNNETLAIVILLMEDIFSPLLKAGKLR